MASVIPAASDARLERRTGSPEGLARRVAELEKQVAKFSQGAYIPSFSSGPNVGPMATTGPPNATTGTAIDIQIPGRYMIVNWATALKTGGGGVGGCGWYMDGTFIGNFEFYHNEINSHRALPPRSDILSLSAGTHYHWVYTHAGMASDSNDRWGFFGWRVSGL